MFEIFLTAVVTLAAILDPLGNVPVFLSLTGGQTEAERRRSADQAILVALVVILMFAVAGRALLGYLDIPVESLTVSGGILLGLTAFQMLIGQLDNPDVSAGANPALVPLATPLLAGPGAIAATMVLMDRNPDLDQRAAVIGGVLVAMALVWVTLRSSVPIGKRLSEGTIHFLTRIMGFVLAALAVELVFSGVRDWVDKFGA